MMKKVACAALLLAVVACRRPELPVGQFLLRLDGPLVAPKQPGGRVVRTAPATLLVFREDREYFEFHFRANESADGTLYVSSTHPHAAALGHWERSRNQVRVVRELVSRADAAAILCKPLTFKIAKGNVVMGNAGGKDEGPYAVEHRLVAPDYIYYIREARESNVRCPGTEKKK
jgi:hypothetical protein